MTGALAALQDVHGIDPRAAEMLVGTSAGSLLAALLGAGVGVDELRAHQWGQPASSRPLAALDARVTRRCLHEVRKLHATGTDVTVLGPGREDLEAIGGNLMAVDRRRAVLNTSMRTSAQALADPEPLDGPLHAAELDERHAG